jgi:hypothetical protein
MWMLLITGSLLWAAAMIRVRTASR